MQFTGDNGGEIEKWQYRYVKQTGHPSRWFVVAKDGGANHRVIPGGCDAAVYDYLHMSWVGVSEGMWIIRGLKDEFYPCDEQTFASTYEKVEDR